MVKFIIGVLIVGFTSFVGYVLAKKYRLRKTFFTQLDEFNGRFLTEVTYYKRPIGEICQRFSYQGDFDDLLQNFLRKQKELGERIGGAAVLDLSEYTFLTQDEQAFVGDYFLTLGKGDSQSQKAYFSAAKERLSTYKTQSEEDCKKYGDLYVKLGFLAGLAILVLII